MRTSSGLRLLTASVAVSASVLCVPPSGPTASNPRHVEMATASPRVALTAAVRAMASAPPNPAHVAAATAAIDRIDPAVGRAAAARQPELRAAVSAALVVPQNSASNAIDAIYQSARGAVTYGVQLASYVLQFVPFGYLISDQLNILYYNLGLPIADSIVYGLIDPVVNDPLNPAVYVNGIVTVGQTTVNAAINTAVAEFNNFFGWLIPPLPPVAAVKSVAAAGTPGVSGVGTTPGLKKAGVTQVTKATGTQKPADANSVADATEPTGSTDAADSTDAAYSTKAPKPTDAADSTKTTGSTKAPKPAKALGHTSIAPSVTKSDDPVSPGDAEKHPGKKSRDHGAGKGSADASTDAKPAKAEASASRH